MRNFLIMQHCTPFWKTIQCTVWKNAKFTLIEIIFSWNQFFSKFFSKYIVLTNFLPVSVKVFKQLHTHCEEIWSLILLKILREINVTEFKVFKTGIKEKVSNCKKLNLFVLINAHQTHYLYVLLLNDSCFQIEALKNCNFLIR